MFNRFAALAAIAAILAAPAHANGRPTLDDAMAHAPPDQPLTLDDAMARVVAVHPELRTFEPQRALREAERAAAVLPPQLVAGASLENAFGTGDARLLTGMEFSLTLASVLERDGKRAAREAVALRRLDALPPRREAVRLDLLAETARRYLDLAWARETHTIGMADVAQRQRAVEGARRRMQAGAAPESELLGAEAAHARAALVLARSVQQQDAGRRHLAALWGQRGSGRAPEFEIDATGLRALPTISDISALADLLARTPELAVFADEQRIREARLQLARTNETADIGWQLGVRRLEASNDVALIGSLSMPIGARRYASPGIATARAELLALESEREVQGQALYSTLVEAHGRYISAQAEAQALQRQVLPLLTRAERAAERAYRAGAISYLEWAQLQSERIQALRQQLDVAREGQRALIEIQRLTGETFVVPTQPATSAAVPEGDTQ